MAQVLAFPCNSFGQQEPESNAGIKEFASKQYGITFPLFTKVEVNGPDAHPVFKFLNENLPKNDKLQVPPPPVTLTLYKIPLCTPELIPWCHSYGITFPLLTKDISFSTTGSPH